MELTNFLSSSRNSLASLSLVSEMLSPPGASKEPLALCISCRDQAAFDKALRSEDLTDLTDDCNSLHTGRKKRNQ